MNEIPRCAICGSYDHGYKYHYPAPTDKLYEKLKERWEDFISTCWEVRYPNPDEELIEIYDEAVDKFCEEYGYSEGLQEMAFHDYWYDTFADMLYQRLEREGYDESKLMVCPECGFKTDSKFVMERHACSEKGVK